MQGVPFSQIVSKMPYSMEVASGTGACLHVLLESSQVLAWHSGFLHGPVKHIMLTGKSKLAV